MTDTSSADGSTLLDAAVRVPDNVVYREFAHETVLLNLDTGQYHGVNRTGARMLEALQNADSVRAAVRELSEQFGEPAERIETDVSGFCRNLIERGLIAVVPGAPA